MEYRKVFSASLKIGLLVVFLIASSSPAAGDTYGIYRKQDQTWTIGNRAIQAVFQLTPTGQFRFRWLKDAGSGRFWRSWDFVPSSPINLTVDGIVTSLWANGKLRSSILKPIRPT
jgi:hypothetical protein